ncbi:FabD/lysophospholipase-like protein [Zopfia rhizophila CBS 207.26]|uniref:FabD/lysophospholipase-like protein n=1 Tax=Zopfia rhizophila CBS 207.26 TaxID=1314779 RepID=A0A6A6E969_9PEZI|nr:FabD/lysophospholipase-like protein [Zopfia rhizophila CBS 207.26]
MSEYDLRLLALDGGGVRGLLTLQILKPLMKTINPESPLKPCDYFDIIRGTSTGGLVLINLQDELERAIREIVVKQGLAEDALLKDALDAKCKVFVCATSSATGDMVRLTSYRSPRSRERLLRTTKIWEAGRATSAASSFFDPITISDFGESFVDGATGANNPVYEVWNEAQDVWPSGSLEDKVKCLVSIGMGVPSLVPFKANLIDIRQSLLAVATEMEKTAERFSRDKSRFDDAGRYYRFSVLTGLEDIGLEESKQRNAIIAATDRYIESQAVFKQMKACVNGMYGKEYRPADMAQIEQSLLPRRQYDRQNVFVLHGLGGIGKTQLTVQFARKHHRKFSAVFWLDGRTEDRLKLSLASCASRIPRGQIAESSRAYSATGAGNLDDVISDVMSWLSRSDNTEWLLIFDDVGEEGRENNASLHAYNVTRYFRQPDHGSVLITTRLATLEQLGDSRKLGRLNEEQRKTMFQNRCGGTHNPVERGKLFTLLDGLPLAISQAGAFLRQTGMSIADYIRLYNQQFEELMKSQDQSSMRLLDSPDRTVWTTWTISVHAVALRSISAANLLFLWACLDNKDLWYGLFAEAHRRDTKLATDLPKWFCNLGSSEVCFISAMQLLCNYSLVEPVQGLASYATHLVVHRWAFYVQNKVKRAISTRLAVLLVGFAVPDRLRKNFLTEQSRLLPHAQRCWEWIVK